MAKSIKLTDAEQVKAHLSSMDPMVRPVVEFIRETVMSTDALISERIKWNNLNFYYSGPMQSFNPKEYKSDIAVFNLYRGRIMLVFPSGARVNDKSGLLQGDYTDGRRTATFDNIEDARRKASDLQEIIMEWLRLVD